MTISGRRASVAASLCEPKTCVQARTAPIKSDQIWPTGRFLRPIRWHLKIFMTLHGCRSLCVLVGHSTPQRWQVRSHGPAAAPFTCPSSTPLPASAEVRAHTDCHLGPTTPTNEQNGSHLEPKNPTRNESTVFQPILPCGLNDSHWLPTLLQHGQHLRFSSRTWHHFQALAAQTLPEITACAQGVAHLQTDDFRSTAFEPVEPIEPVDPRVVQRLPCGASGFSGSGFPMPSSDAKDLGPRLGSRLNISPKNSASLNITKEYFMLVLQSVQNSGGVSH